MITVPRHFNNKNNTASLKDQLIQKVLICCFLILVHCIGLGCLGDHVSLFPCVLLSSPLFGPSGSPRLGITRFDRHVREP